MKRYDVTINGIGTTLLLSDEDARARGLKVPAATPEPATGEPMPVPTKNRAPANKARKPANKSAAAED